VTKDRRPLTSERALTKIASLIGWPAVAAIAKRHERSVRRWGDNDIGTKIALDTAAALDVAYSQAGGDGTPLLDWYQLRIELGVARARASIAEQADRAAKAATEAGQAVAAQMRALSPTATDADRLIAVKETEEAIAALKDTLPDLGANPEGDTL
jgi:hypothetical protein